MSASPNALRWDGGPGHYEVYYLSATDPASGVGLWIRYTMLAPAKGGDDPTCALWLSAMDPGADPPLLARKQTLPIDQLRAAGDPFSLHLGDARLDDHGMQGAIQDASWDLRWEPRLPAYNHVHPLLRALRAAQTTLVLPHADLAVSGSVTLAEGRRLQVDGARGGQAHLWGSKHARRWAWVHCNDLRRIDGEPVPDTFVDAVSVVVSRWGREVGPSSPVVGRFLGEDFSCTAPHRVLANPSRFGLTGWHLEAIDGRRRIRLEVDSRRELMVGVTYTDPDGELAHCYNSEVASLRLQVWDRTASGPLGWTLRETLQGEGRTHFEYAQRDPVPDMPLLV